MPQLIGGRTIAATSEPENQGCWCQTFDVESDGSHVLSRDVWLGEYVRFSGLITLLPTMGRARQPVQLWNGATRTAGDFLRDFAAMGKDLCRLHQGAGVPVSIEELLESEVKCERERLTAQSSRRRRLVGREVGRALEILGHAIEYLADEYVHAGKSLRANDPEVEAIQLLMALNRRIYFECPEIPTLRDRVRGFLARSRR